jgi:hypothetical protein
MYNDVLLLDLRFERASKAGNGMVYFGNKIGKNFMLFFVQWPKMTTMAIKGAA